MSDRRDVDARDIGAKQSFVASPGHEFKCVSPATQAIQMWISQPMPFDRRTRGERESVSYGDRNAIWFCVRSFKKQSPVLIRQNRTRDTIGVRMKKIILATALAGLGSTAALAADLGARTYTKAPVVVAAGSGRASAFSSDRTFCCMRPVALQ